MLPSQLLATWEKTGGRQDVGRNFGHPKLPRQSTAARMPIGDARIKEFDSDDICIRRHSDAWRTRVVDEAVRIWRATSRTTPVEIFITPKGRECGRGIELAVELAKRGVPVNYSPVRAR